MRIILAAIALPFRLVGIGFFLLFVTAAGYDTVRSVAAGGLRLSRLGELWFQISPGTLNLAQALTQRYVSPYLWDPVIQTLLAWPAVVSLAILSVAFGLFARIIHRPR